MVKISLSGILKSFSKIGKIRAIWFDICGILSSKILFRLQNNASTLGYIFIKWHPIDVSRDYEFCINGWKLLWRERWPLTHRWNGSYICIVWIWKRKIILTFFLCLVINSRLFERFSKIRNNSLCLVLIFGIKNERLRHFVNKLVF